MNVIVVERLKHDGKTIEPGPKPVDLPEEIIPRLEALGVVRRVAKKAVEKDEKPTGAA